MNDAILWKDEGPGGPVLVRRNGIVTNYEDGHLRNLSGEPLPKWFPRADAEGIATKEGLPFVET